MISALSFAAVNTPVDGAPSSGAVLLVPPGTLTTSKYTRDAEMSYYLSGITLPDNEKGLSVPLTNVKVDNEAGAFGSFLGEEVEDTLGSHRDRLQSKQLPRPAPYFAGGAVETPNQRFGNRVGGRTARAAFPRVFCLQIGSETPVRTWGKEGVPLQCRRSLDNRLRPKKPAPSLL